MACAGDSRRATTMQPAPTPDRHISSSVEENIVKKILAIAFALAFAGGLAVPNPARAGHGTEGTVTVAGVEACSGTDAKVADSKCKWTTTDPNGWSGIGPFTITWTKNGVTTTFKCPKAKRCSTTGAAKDPIPAKAAVVSFGHGRGGGTFAAGDADGHNGK